MQDLAPHRVLVAVSRFSDLLVVHHRLLGRLEEDELSRSNPPKGKGHPNSSFPCPSMEKDIRLI